jgi:hypothetical protein
MASKQAIDSFLSSRAAFRAFVVRGHNALPVNLTRFFRRLGGRFPS